LYRTRGVKKGRGGGICCYLSRTGGLGKKEREGKVANTSLIPRPEGGEKKERKKRETFSPTNFPEKKKEQKGEGCNRGHYPHPVCRPNDRTPGGKEKKKNEKEVRQPHTMSLEYVTNRKKKKKRKRERSLLFSLEDRGHRRKDRADKKEMRKGLFPA